MLYLVQEPVLPFADAVTGLVSVGLVSDVTWFSSTANPPLPRRLLRCGHVCCQHWLPEHTLRDLQGTPLYSLRPCASVCVCVWERERERERERECVCVFVCVCAWVWVWTSAENFLGGWSRMEVPLKIRHLRVSEKTGLLIMAFN